MSFSINHLFLFLLTVAAFYIAKYVNLKMGNPVLLQPLLLSVTLVIAILFLVDIPYTHYLNSNLIFQWLLGPAVVALAIPLYQNLNIIRHWLGGILFTILSATIMGLLLTWGLAEIFSVQADTLIALMTKSATTPIALSINEIINGNKALAATVVMFTGLLGAMIGPPLLKRMGFHDHRVMGIALGLTSHAIGTHRALEISPICGAFSALAMTLTGVFLAIFLPMLTTNLL
jgi:putative effector of murein hydrolase